MRIKSLVACLALALAASAWAVTPAGAAEAPQRIISCGQVITEDSAYLARDLSCTAGFVIPRFSDRSNKVTIDLRGHRLSGRGTGTAFTVGGDPPFFDSLIVRNGRVDHWGKAFEAVFSNLTVTKVQIDRNNLGIYCGGGNCAVRDSLIKNNVVGTTANNSYYFFARNVFLGNGIGSRASGPAVAGATYTYNVFTNNRVGVRVAPHGSVQLTRNAFTRNGIGVQGVPGSPASGEGWSVSLTENVFIRNRDGLYLITSFERDETASLKRNLALRNTRYGFYAPGATDAGGNRAARNGKPCVGVVCARP